jgi:hypothetical protein
MKSDLADVEVCLHMITEKAYRVSLDGDTGKSVWVPKSQCELEQIGTTSFNLTAPQWLLKEKGLI